MMSRLKQKLWPWSRMTPWRKVQTVIEAGGIGEGPHSCPNGLRHGYGVAAVSKGIALNMLQKWLGHAQLETTSIYANAVGEEEQRIAARMWTLRQKEIYVLSRKLSNTPRNEAITVCYLPSIKPRIT